MDDQEKLRRILAIVNQPGTPNPVTLVTRTGATIQVIFTRVIQDDDRTEVEFINPRTRSRTIVPFGSIAEIADC